MKMAAGARSSLLSQAQFKEVQIQLKKAHPHILLEPVWAQSPGDRDRNTSLRTLERSDFFTRDLDLMLLEGSIRVAIHSAKDLPDPIPEGLSLVCLTRGLDPRDSLVLNESSTLESLKRGACIATSSMRREALVATLRSDLCFVDLRGTIEERLAKLGNGEVDGVVIAEAALIRLQWTHLNRLFLPGDTAPLQGRLAVVASSSDVEIQEIFHAIHYPLFRN